MCEGMVQAWECAGAKGWTTSTQVQAGTHSHVLTAFQSHSTVVGEGSNAGRVQADELVVQDLGILQPPFLERCMMQSGLLV